MAQPTSAVEDIPLDLDDAAALAEPLVEDLTGADDDALDDEANLQAMEALLGEPQGQDQHDAPEGGQQAAKAPESPESMTAAEQTKLRQLEAGYTRKFQALADQQRQLDAQLQQLQELQQGLLQQRATAPAAPAQKLTMQDCVDPDTGELDLVKHQQFLDQREEALEARLADKYLNPLQANLQAQQDSAALAEIQKIQIEEARLEKLFPHFRDPAVKAKVVARLRRLDNVTVADLGPAYFAEYPDQQLKAHQRVQVARAKQKPGGQPPPATPPNRQTLVREQKDYTDEELDEAMARDLSRMTGVPLRP